MRESVVMMRLGLVAALLVLTCVPASAEEPVKVPRHIERMITDLDAEEVRVRERATRELRRLATQRNRSMSTALISRLLHAGGLTPEQRARLIMIDRAAFEQSPRPGMGIQFLPQDGGGGVLVNPVSQEGFFADRVLSYGDRVLVADGVNIANLNDLRFSILSRDPGDVMRLGIERAGEHLEVDVVLGTYSNLQNTQSLSEHDFEQAWSRRARRLRAATPGLGVIDCRGTSPGAPYDGSRDEVSLGVGGAQRPGMTGQQIAAHTRAAQRAVTRVQVQRALQPIDIHQRLVGSRRNIQNNLERMNEQLKDGDLTPAMRLSTEQQILRLEMQLTAIEERLIAHEKELAEP